MRTFVSCLLGLIFIGSVPAGAQIPDATRSSPPPLAGNGGSPSLTTMPKADGLHLPVASDVASSVKIDAVLLPSATAKRIFGKAISDNYAVVQLIISNHNQDAALILQSAFLDYSHWLFSNNFQGPLKRPNSIDTSPFQQANNPSEVASTEARLVRSDLQDAQFWTARNAFIRAITAVGSIASGYQFLATSQNYSAGIGAFGNQVVPALATFWPDRTQLQINRISDFGFQTNHVIPKGGSDIVVAFFPLDRFLTPSLRKLFIKSPAIFFVPGEMLLDSKYSRTLVTMLRNSGVIGDSDNQATISAALGHYERIRAGEQTILSTTESAIIGMLDKVSLNNIRLVIGGIMTIDTNAVPAVIDSISITEDSSKAETWKKDATVHGTISGSFLSGGVVSVVGGSTLGVGDLTVDAKNSSDKRIAFSFPLTKDVPSGTKLQFVITKLASDGSSTISKPSELAVKYSAAPPAAAEPAKPGTESNPAVPQAAPVPNPAAQPAVDQKKPKKQ